jgi:hypothetical protein
MVPTENLSTDWALQGPHSAIFGTTTQLMTRQHQIFLLFNLRNLRNLQESAFPSSCKNSRDALQET